MIDRTGLPEFLRNRRQALQPQDVGLPRGQRRRTTGLRREEVAVAQDLHLSLDERDHLFTLAAHAPPQRGESNEHISPGLLRMLDQSHSLMVYTAVPGSDSYDKLQLRSVIGATPLR